MGQSFAKLCKIEINPSAVMEESNSVKNFISYLEPFLQPQSIPERLPPSDVVGNIRFSHPTLYVFPGGQGDSALFGINGFNMLIDGGFSRKACFWDFTRHLDRLDAILVTRMSDENTQGINAVLERKTAQPVYPQIGHFFANILDPKKDREKTEDEDKDKLLVNVVHEGNTMIDNLRILNLKPQICFRDNVCDPINLYHKVGHGKLDMYVLNPSRDSREVREFLSRWHDDSGHLGKFKSGMNVDGKELWLPIANLVSICALLIWYPANPNDTITRLLFPGSTPQHKIFKGLEKLKRLECLKQPVCSPNSIQNTKSSSKSEKRKRLLKSDNKNILPDNSMIEKKEKMAKKRIEKLRKEKEEREKQEKKEKRDKEKEELEKAEKEKKEKERLEKLEKRKKAHREKKEKERQERKEREAALAAAKKEKEEKEAAAKKEKEEKEAAAKKEKDEKDAAARKEREALRKEKEEKEANRKKEREAKVQKDLENKKEMSDPKSNDVLIKKKVSSSSTKSRLKETSSKTKSNETAISSRKIMPSKPTTAKHTTPPPSKLKKDENNKKVMENRKAAVAAKTHRSKPNNDEKVKVKKVINKKPINNDEGS